jgi:signal transduction histidine kinase
VQEKKLTAKHTGMGLGNMQERTKSFSGKFAIHSEPEHGTKVTIQVPAMKDKKKE